MTTSQSYGDNQLTTRDDCPHSSNLRLLSVSLSISSSSSCHSISPTRQGHMTFHGSTVVCQSVWFFKAANPSSPRERLCDDTFKDQAVSRDSCFSFFSLLLEVSREDRNASEKLHLAVTDRTTTSGDETDWPSVRPFSTCKWLPA